VVGAGSAGLYDEIGLIDRHRGELLMISLHSKVMAASSVLTCGLVCAQTCSPQWDPMFGGTNGMSGWVYALAVHVQDGAADLYAGGVFTSAGGVPAERVARWDGLAWSPLGAGFGPGEVTALQSFDSGQGPMLYAGGQFQNSGGSALSNIARWDGTSWLDVGGGLAAPSSVRDMLVFDDGSGAALYVGGNFLLSGGTTTGGISRWDGTSWQAIGPDTLNGDCYALAVYNDGSGSRLYAGGIFFNPSEFSVASLVMWDGVAWEPVGLNKDGLGLNDLVTSLAVFNDGSGHVLMVGGSFTMAGDIEARSIACWDGNDWSALGADLNNPPSAMSVFDDGGGPALYVGGIFTQAGGITARTIARWDGTSWSPLGAGTTSCTTFPGCFAAVGALEPFWTGENRAPALFVGGSFSVAGGQTSQRMAVWRGCDADTDDDGLSDDWETLGVPYVDGHGTVRRLTLPGADPLRRDVYVEVDVMSGAPFSQTALGAVRAAFAGSPGINPDGSTGIALHTVVDETNVPLSSPVAITDMATYRQDWFGTATERGRRDGLLSAKARAFRHCLFYDQLSAPSVGTVLGRSLGIPATAFGVSLGGTGWSAALTETQLAATFMHELGHAVGLYHGGNEDVHYKPNYVSVMNYNFDATSRLVNGQWGSPRLDFSREVLAALHESSLNETIGIATQFSSLVRVPHGWQNAGGNTSLALIELGSGGHDWNQDSTPDVSAVADLNHMPAGHPLGLFALGPTPGQTLRGFDDWASLSLAVPPRHGRGCETCPDSDCLLSRALVEWNLDNSGLSPDACAVDLNKDGVLDFFDVQQFLNWYAAGDVRADFAQDGTLDFFDVQAFLGLYSAGCP
jgi:hypothetical protein